MFCNYKSELISEVVTKSELEICTTTCARGVKNASSDRGAIKIVSCVICAELKERE